jgi:Protein of unknown function (DUF3732)
MSVNLLDIVLYPHSGAPRVLSFNASGLSVITGDSKTGKSTLVDIVDYCLGSRECGVSEGRVLSTVAWYAIRLGTRSGPLFVARRAPEPGQRSSGQACIRTAVASVSDAPGAASDLESSVNREGLVTLLTEVLDIPVTSNTTESALPEYNVTARHASAFLFQKQHDLINPRALFRHQEQVGVGSSIKETIQFFVGAIGTRDVADLRQLSELRRTARTLRARQLELEALVGSDSGRAETLVREAVEIGLGGPPEGDGRDVLVRYLRQLALGEATSGLDESGATVQEESTTHLRTLLTEQAELRRNYAALQDEMDVLRNFGKVRTEFELEAGEQVSRLSAIDVIPATDGESANHCPVCEQEVHGLPPMIAEIRDRLESLRETVEAFASDPPHYVATLQALEGRVEETRRRMGQIARQIAAVEESRRRFAAISDTRVRQAVTIGRISLYLESVRDYGAAEELASQLRLIEIRIKELEERVGRQALEDRLDSVGYSLSQDVGSLANMLELEWSGYPVRLDLRRLTVVLDLPAGPTPLVRVGGGENQVAYHLIAHLALQRLFTARDLPVPRFVFIDQPSQAYFPSEAAFAELARGERVGDLAKAERLMHLIYEAVGGRAFQVILTEHADIREAWFRDAVVDEWRDGKGLIPEDWTG